ncbi:hypothetical protein TEA_016014 [Camellia sinensis var. sinensis]|uniref:VTT domain-containing protein n=1 Tax=Camellia sinensis var. sinensis TaxID=542762 RepID=A0A4S4DJW2_CAMSN|nr:hypothetical protein TEA_016014 [Camellia sinensis var. sinensis]
MSQAFVIAFFSLSSKRKSRTRGDENRIEEKQSAKSAHLEPQKKAQASLPQLRLLYVASPRLALSLGVRLGALFKTLVGTISLGGGYLLGLPVGFIADSIGATVGAAAAFLLGRTIGRSFVVSKLNDYPQFQAVAIATQKLGFMILFLLRLVPIIPFNMLNYALSVTPIPLGKYMLASWLGKMSVTLALVYIGTPLKDLSDVTHGWHDFSKAHWALIIAGLVVSGFKDALEKALAEKDDIDSIVASPEQPIVADPTADLHQPHNDRSRQS